MMEKRTKKIAGIVTGLSISVISFISLPGCQNTGNDKTRTTAADSAGAAAGHPASGKMCFRKVSGNAGKDTLAVTLILKGEKIGGEMYSSVYEKDARRGTLEGKLKGNDIEAVWTFMQEGMTDTLNLAFRMEGEALLQRPLRLNTQTGREQTDFSSDWIHIPKADCD